AGRGASEPGLAAAPRDGHSILGETGRGGADGARAALDRRAQQRPALRVPEAGVRRRVGEGGPRPPRRGTPPARRRTRPGRAGAGRSPAEPRGRGGPADPRLHRPARLLIRRTPRPGPSPTTSDI